MKQGLIYKATNTVNGKAYIGQTTVGISRRKAAHTHAALCEETGMLFHKAIRKYGVNSFTWEIVWEGDADELNEQERHFIKHFDSVNNGYNLDEGGNDSYHRSAVKNGDKRLNTTRYTFYNKHTGELLRDITVNELVKHSNLNNTHSAVYRLIKGKIKSYKGWTLWHDICTTNNE